jgi:hypothetical protein
MKYLFIFFCGMKASFFEQIVKQSAAILEKNNTSTFCKSIFFDGTNKGLSFLKNNHKALLTFSSLSLGLALITKQESTNNFLLKLNKSDKSKEVKKILAYAFFAGIMYVYVCKGVGDKFFADQADKLFSKHCEYLKNFHSNVLNKKLLLNEKVLLNKKLIYFLNTNNLKQSMLSMVYNVYKPISVGLFVAFCVCLYLCFNSDKHIPIPLYQQVGSIIIIFVSFYRFYKSISKEFFHCLIIFFVSIYSYKTINHFLFLILKLTVFPHKDNNNVKELISDFTSKITGFFSVCAIVLIFYKMHLLINLFNYNPVGATVYYFLLLLFNKGEEKNLDEKFISMLQEENYSLDNILKIHEEFANYNGKCLINYNELSFDLKEVIKKNSIIGQKVREEFGVFMTNRVRLFLIQAISHCDHQEEQKKFFKLAFDYYKIMMEKHAFCSDCDDLNDQKHASCKNGNRDKILNDVLSNPDSPFYLEFDYYLEFVGGNESLYNDNTTIINYDAIKVKQKIEKCNYKKNIEDPVSTWLWLFDLERFLYKNF